MTSVVVFLGPTLPAEAAREVLDAEILPPAAHGDVLRAALRRPRVIALVDGLFERAPSVWHKEILFALSEGIHVYGAASMGALRAAELGPFGMRGVGEVYRAYADGALEDDDEVAVAHAGPGERFRALSDAMVDVRATLAVAVENGVVGAEAAAALAERVKRTFYPRRLLLEALDRDDGEHERLRAWLPEGRVRRKREDALALLRTIRDDLAAGLEPFRPSWSFERTRHWEAARRRVETAADAAPAPTALESDDRLEAVLDELRLDPDRYRRLLDAALLATLARDEAARQGVDASSWARQDALDDERRRRGLLDPERTRAWLAARGQDESELPAVARRLAAVAWAHRTHRAAVAAELAFALRDDDGYQALAARAERKRAALAERRPAAADCGDEELVDRYFRERLGREVPADLEAWAVAQGWSDARDLTRALRRERLAARPD